MRATSVGASAILLALAVFAAFSVTISFQTDSGLPPISFPVVPLPPEPTPPVVREQTPPPRPLLEEPTEASFQPLTLPEHVVATGPTTYLPVATGPSEITNPRWLRQPRDLASYYPGRALAREIGGQVLLDCLVDVNGALDCSVVTETPVNWGFGQAALRISRDYRMVPALRAGQAVQGRYRMRVPFEVR
jgi:protein TonB